MASTPHVPIDSSSSSALPSALPSPPTLNCVTRERKQVWQNVEDLFREHFHEPDVEAAKVVLACAAAHRISAFPPVWNMAVAVAGSMKTVILESLDGLDSVYLIDEVTPQAFISGKIDNDGKKRKTPASLLHRIGEQGIVVSADFSTILTSDPRNRAKVFSQLRRIYDGHLRREFGSDENLDEREWKGRLTFMAGVTPEVDRHHKVFSSLGDRFIRTRWPRAGGADAAMRAMRQNREVPQRVKARVHALMSPILMESEVAAPVFPDRLFQRLANLGELIALARAYVPRDRRDDIEGEAQAESNTRLPQELAQVGRGWAALMSRAEVSEEDFKLIRRAAFDSLPPMRRYALDRVAQGMTLQSPDYPPTTVFRATEDLEAIGLIMVEKKMGRPRAEGRYVLTKKAESLLIGAGEDVR